VTSEQGSGSGRASEPAGGGEAVAGSPPDDPAAADVPLVALAPGAVRLWRIEGLLRGALVAGGVLVADWFLRPPVPLGLAGAVVAALAVATVVLVPPLRYRAWGFSLRDTDLYLRHGVWFRTTSIVPHARIQHVDTRHGPVERWLGLAELVVYTAGVRGAIISIPALERETAESLRDQLAALSGAGDAV
jgi:uncharacterized protein